MEELRLEQSDGRLGDEHLELGRHVETRFRKLKDLCDQLGVCRSGGKNKVLSRLRQQREILEGRMTTELAILEGNRDPEMPKTPHHNEPAVPELV